MMKSGWGRMQIMAQMLRDAGIPFIWRVFTNSKVETHFEEFHFFKYRLYVVDYIVDADYTVLLSDSERNAIYRAREFAISSSLYCY